MNHLLSNSFQALDTSQADPQLMRQQYQVIYLVLYIHTLAHLKKINALIFENSSQANRTDTYKTYSPADRLDKI